MTNHALTVEGDPVVEVVLNVVDEGEHALVTAEHWYGPHLWKNFILRKILINCKKKVDFYLLLKGPQKPWHLRLQERPAQA